MIFFMISKDTQTLNALKFKGYPIYSNIHVVTIQYPVISPRGLDGIFPVFSPLPLPSFTSASVGAY